MQKETLTARQKIMKVLARRKTPANSKMISERTKVNWSTIRNVLAQMVQEGIVNNNYIVQSEKEGRYSTGYVLNS